MTHDDSSTQVGTRALVDPRRLRATLGGFATGVTVVTYRDADGQERGATMNSFTSVSMDPPLVLVSVAKQAKAADGLRDSPFAVNVLAANQLPLAMLFAGQPVDGLAVPWCGPVTAPPRLAGAAAWLECLPFATHEAGDHLIVVGEVIHHDSRPIEPLVFHGGEFRRPGLKLLRVPRSVALDGAPIPDAVVRLHDLHALMDAGIDTEPLDA